MAPSSVERGHSTCLGGKGWETVAGDGDPSSRPALALALGQDLPQSLSQPGGLRGSQWPGLPKHQGSSYIWEGRGIPQRYGQGAKWWLHRKCLWARGRTRKGGPGAQTSCGPTPTTIHTGASRVPVSPPHIPHCHLASNLKLPGLPSRNLIPSLVGMLGWGVVAGVSL